jgi:predicted unusual protein kinase regulating ubiquinone biosynthesis (AarF/ABC1/UbiB family)
MTGRARRARTFRIVWLAVRMVTSIVMVERRRGRMSGEEFARVEERVLTAEAIRLRETALQLEGLLIKLGQFLSTRVDVLPEAFTRELGQLRDAVPPVPWPAVRTQVERELGSEISAVFSTFVEAPVAAASLGQVHRAVLVDGRAVAVKVQRPGVGELVHVDLQAVLTVVGFFRRFRAVERKVDLLALYRELERTTLEELDYLSEAEHARRFGANFAGQDDVVVPEIFPEHGSRRLLVMEFVSGLRLDDRTALIEAGLDPRAIAERVVRTYLQQVLRDGLFHADPHPGNIFADPAGRLIYVDFGMMGELSAEDRGTFGRFVMAVVHRDYDALVEAVDDLGFLRRHADRDVLKRGLALALDHMSGLPPQGPVGAAFEEFLDELREFIRSEPFQLPAQYAFLGRAAGILLGVCTGLDPDVDFVRLLRENALPYLDMGTDGAAEEAGPGGIPWKTLRREAARLGTSLYRLPARLEKLLEKAESGELRVRVELGAIARRLEERNASSERRTRALLAIGAGAISAWFTVAGRIWPDRIGWVLTALLLLSSLHRPRS